MPTILLRFITMLSRVGAKLVPRLGPALGAAAARVGLKPGLTSRLISMLGWGYAFDKVIDLTKAKNSKRAASKNPLLWLNSLSTTLSTDEWAALAVNPGDTDAEQGTALLIKSLATVPTLADALSDSEAKIVTDLLREFKSSDVEGFVTKAQASGLREDVVNLLITAAVMVVSPDLELSPKHLASTFVAVMMMGATTAVYTAYNPSTGTIDEESIDNDCLSILVGYKEKELRDAVMNHIQSINQARVDGLDVALVCDYLIQRTKLYQLSIQLKGGYYA